MDSGATIDIKKILIGPPTIIPVVPAKNIIIAFEPNFFTSGISMLIVNNTRLEGKRYLDATK